MHKHLFSAAALALAIGLPFTASAQGRHDEKPHGVMKSAPDTEQTQARSTGGRHDEGGTTHGKKRAVAKKKADKAADSPTEK